MKTRNVFFGGGFDSTYHVLNLINSNLYDKIFCLYFKHVDHRLNIEEELKTLYRLQETYPGKIEIEIKKEPPEESELSNKWIEDGLRTESIITIKDSKHYQPTSNPYKDKRRNLQYIIKNHSSYEWCYHIYNPQTVFFTEYLHTKECDNRIFDMATVRNERSWNRFFKLPYNLKRDDKQDRDQIIYNPSTIKNYGTLNCKVNVENYPHLNPLKNIRFPIFHIFKWDCAKFAIFEEEFDDEQIDILINSMTCREKNAPCGTCDLCRHRRWAKEKDYLLGRRVKSLRREIFK